jgi:hypothetical protein
MAAYLALASSSAAESVEPTSALAIQGGWWSVEAEWRTRIGIFGAIGVPWVAIPLTSHAKWLIPYAARLGYQHDVSRTFKLRGAVHVAGTYGRENPCGGCGEIVSRVFVFAEVGGRYEATSGFVAGVDLPIFGLGSSSGDPFPPPISLAFSQAYVGWSCGGSGGGEGGDDRCSHEVRKST